jgi:hypothetical protein
MSINPTTDFIIKQKKLHERRWKYQIKMGGIWGVFMTVLYCLTSKTPFQRNCHSYFFLFKAIAYILVGIFV